MSAGVPQMDEFEGWSREQYAHALDGEAPFPDVVYFERNPPHGLTASGRYLAYSDFMNILPDLKVASEPVTTLYHRLILHLIQPYGQSFYAEADKRLRNNPDNHSHWNKYSPTWRYRLLGNALIPYAQLNPKPEHTIKRVGPKGRIVLRSVLFDEFSEE